MADKIHNALPQFRQIGAGWMILQAIQESLATSQRSLVGVGLESKDNSGSLTPEFESKTFNTVVKHLQSLAAQHGDPNNTIPIGAGTLEEIVPNNVVTFATSTTSAQEMFASLRAGVKSTMSPDTYAADGAELLNSPRLAPIMEIAKQFANSDSSGFRPSKILDINIIRDLITGNKNYDDQGKFQ